jgi:hypothetical protein
MIWRVHDALKTSPLIQQKVGNRIKFYEYPPTDKVQGVYIVIDPVEPPRPGDYADNQWLTEEHFFQIDVWSKNMDDTKAVAKEVQKIMWKELGFGLDSPGPDEYDKDTGIYRDARRYIGKEYVE